MNKPKSKAVEILIAADEIAHVEFLQKLRKKTEQGYQALIQATAKPQLASDPFEAFHDDMKAKGATNKEVATEWIRTRPPKERNKLLQEGDEAIKVLMNRCRNLVQARKKSAKR